MTGAGDPTRLKECGVEVRDGNLEVFGWEGQYKQSVPSFDSSYESSSRLHPLPVILPLVFYCGKAP
jgi:hypothetical protein